MIGIVESLLLAVASTSLVTWLAVMVFEPVRKAGSESRASDRLLWARAWLYAPLWVPLLVVGAALASGTLGWLFGQLDHCATDAHLHHLCLRHPPHLSEHWFGRLVSLALLLAGILVTSFVSARLFLLRRQTRALLAISRGTDLGDQVRVLEQESPAALTVGWPRPVILLSRGLLDHVSPATLEVILAHERAHVTRSDTLLNVLDRLMASFYPIGVGKRLLERLILAREQICDTMAAESLGCYLTVAQALTEVARMKLPALSVGVAMSVSKLEARVMYLLAPNRGAQPGLGFPLILLLLFGLGPGHVLLEWCVTFLLH